MTDNKKFIGILGGMGPQASCELYRLINSKSVNNFNAKKNDDFPHLLISNLPVPDLIDDQESEKQTCEMLKLEAQRLEKAGATDLFLVCNTMHAYADSLFEDIRVRFHSLIEIVATHIQNKNVEKVFILSTATTLKTNLYQDALNKLNIEYSLPSESLKGQTVQKILDYINGGIVNDMPTFIQNLEREVKNSGSNYLLLGCTELPLIFKNNHNFKMFSSLDILANKICETYYS